jgi:hypothetical protein
MNVAKCANCGFVGFPERGSCKRCGKTLLSLTLPRDHQADISAERNFRKFLKVIAMLMVVVGMVIGVVIVRAKLKPDPKLAYIEAIKRAPRFKEPITVRVNQKPIPGYFSIHRGPDETRSTVYISRSAYVLESLGLLRIAKETSYHESDSELFTWESKSERWVILLTEKGQQESVNWSTTEESDFVGSQKVPWWQIPIGQREITRIESITEPIGDHVDMIVRWRWHPNKIGESFDCSGPLVGSEEAKEGARSLGWNSQTEYSAETRLQQVGNGWEVQSLSFDSAKIAGPKVPQLLP